MSNYKDVQYLGEMIERIRNIDYIKEEKENEESDDNQTDAVPYTTKDELMSSIMDTAKQQFSADFSNIKSPMLYYPNDGDVTLSGEISDLNDAKFQFRYKDSNGNGCYLWINPLQITDETIRKISIINGVYKNWKKSLSTAEDIKPMGYRDKEKTNETILRRGDDID